jgi:small subunit ribosomal protein S14
MLFLKVKDLKKRKSFFNQEKSRKVNKFVFINLLAKKKNSIKVFQLKNSKRLSSKVKIKNRCIYTNRNKGVSKYFSLSRISQKDFMQLGLVPGFIKSVW